MKISITCHYCGHHQGFNVVSREVLEMLVCNRCGDKNLKIVETSKAKIDTYAGAPPFETKEELEKRKKTPPTYKTDEDLERLYGSWYGL